MVKQRDTKEQKQKSYGANTKDISCHFKSLQSTLVSRIKKADVVIGCVAWLTHTSALDALKNVKYGVRIVVQKEDFIRSDAKNRFNNNYKQIKAFPIGTKSRTITNSLVDNLNVNETTEAIRCVGNYNDKKKIAFPRMHNKFLIFCRFKNNVLAPYAVWTGSLNLTETGSRSFENVIEIKNNPKICKAYLNEWAQLFALSEKLDWTKRLCTPDFTLQTTTKYRSKQIKNTDSLHKLKIPDQSYGQELQNNNTISKNIECYFRDIETVLVQKIKEADVIFGSIAWLSNDIIINALKQVKLGVRIIVQKEDFLRPDASEIDKKKFYNNYMSIEPFLFGQQIYTDSLIDELSTCRIHLHDEAIRCVGNHNADKVIAFPRMHNKCLIFFKFNVDEYAPDFGNDINANGLDLETDDNIIYGEQDHSFDEFMKNEFDNWEDKYVKRKSIQPYAVWTGSLNLTSTAMNSFENGVYIKDSKISKAYLDDWAQIFALSEKLDWHSNWCEPELRIGS